MSDKRQLRPPKNSPALAESPLSSRRPRKRNADDDKQRERKRALDRRAQRASREKTRSHIAHLEKMVRILSEKNGSTTTSELLKEMTGLHAEIDRLRKIVDSIKSILGADIFDTPLPAASQRQIAQSSEHSSRRSSGSPSANGAKVFEASSPSDEPPKFPANERETWEENSLDGESRDLGMIATDNLDDGQLDNSQSDSNSPGYTSCWADGVDDGPIELINSWEGCRNKPLERTLFWNLPSPLETAMPEIPASDFIPCKAWMKASAIYAGIFKYPKERVLSANEVEAGSLFKVVKEGWGSLSLKERSNPVLQILKEVDQNLFWSLDPVTKIANLYKSMLLLKYYFNANTKNFENLQVWQRPVHSQRIRRHPILIDFFPWPALRDRLIRYHNYYFATNDFSINYRQHFKFNWPYTFEDTCRYDSATRTYTITPLFERYHRDMRCWALEKDFFRNYPELIGEISVYPVDLDERSCRSPLPPDTNAHVPFSMGGGWHQTNRADDIGAADCDFGDDCGMDLFNDY